MNCKSIDIDMEFSIWLESVVSKEKIGQYGRYSVFLVDGDEVRGRSVQSDDFNDVGTHLTFSFIPNNEIWITRDIERKEIPLMIQRGLVEYEEDRKNVKNFYDRAMQLEKRARKDVRNSDLYYRYCCDIGDISVWFVDGETVRNLYKVDFSMGGNSGPYSWVPENEIWIEKNLRGEEIPLTILHEYVGNVLMKYKKMSYDEAHNIAKKVDWHQRGKFTMADVLKMNVERALFMAKQYRS